MGLSQIRLVFSEANKILFGSDVTLNEQGTGSLELKEDWLPSIKFCYLKVSDELLIFAECGQIPVEKQLDMFKDLLCRQFLFEESRGIEYALAPFNEALVVQYKLPVINLDANRLIDVLVDFIQAVSKVRLKIIDRAEEEMISKTEEFLTVQQLA